jgi:hypothetical protein
MCLLRLYHSDLLGSGTGASIKVECWDKDIVGKDFMGEVDVQLRRERG